MAASDAGTGTPKAGDPLGPPQGPFPAVSNRRNEMWSEERYDYERLPRERLPPRRPDEPPQIPQDLFLMGLNMEDFHRVVSFGLKKPPLLDRPAEGTCNRFDYSHGHGYRDYDDGRGFAHERRGGPPHRNDEPGYRFPREDHPGNRHPDFRDIREGMRRKNIYPHYVRDRSPHKRDSPYYRESPVSRRDSPHSRSGSSVSSRGYSPDRSKAYAFQHGRSMSSFHKRNVYQPDKERTSSHSLKSSRDVSPSETTTVPPSKILDKNSRLSEKELADSANRWGAEKDKADGSSVPVIPDFDAGSSEQLYVEHHEETDNNAGDMDNNELFEDDQHVTRSKAIAAKTKEIEQVYRQDCETFGAVVKMLVEKDPSLEKPIQFSLRQNLQEIGERCIDELKRFIADYDAASQAFEES